MRCHPRQLVQRQAIGTQQQVAKAAARGGRPDADNHHCLLRAPQPHPHARGAVCLSACRRGVHRAPLRGGWRRGYCPCTRRAGTDLCGAWVLAHRSSHGNGLGAGAWQRALALAGPCAAPRRVHRSAREPTHPGHGQLPQLQIPGCARHRVGCVLSGRRPRRASARHRRPSHRGGLREPSQSDAPMRHAAETALPLLVGRGAAHCKHRGSELQVFRGAAARRGRSPQPTA